MAHVYITKVYMMMIVMVIMIIVIDRTVSLEEDMKVKGRNGWEEIAYTSAT